MSTRAFPRRRSRRRGAPALLGLAFTLLAATRAPAQSDLDSLWNDPAFQKAFVGGYGFLAEVEPRVTPEEVQILETVRPMMQSDLAKAERALVKRMKPDCSAVLDYTLGGIQFQQGRIDQALETHQIAVAKFPSFRRAWRNLGMINAQANKFDAAIAAFTRMIELGGGDGYSYGLLGAAYASKSDFQAAEGAYRNALLLQPEQVQWRLGLTRAVLSQEKFEDAASLASTLIALYPERHEFWLLQAHAFFGMGRPLRAAENLEIVHQLGKSTVETLNRLGDVYVGEGLPDLAASAYVRAIGLDAAQDLQRPFRAIAVLFQRGAVDEAGEVAAKVRAAFEPRMEDDERRELLKYESRIAMAHGDSSEKVVAVLEEMIRLDPLDGDALILLGQHYAENGEPDRAILHYERAAGVAAFEQTARMRHAQVLIHMGRYGDAIPLLRRVQEIGPREDVARLLEQVERIARSRR